MELTPDQEGGITELAIAATAARLGIGVPWPMTEGSRRVWVSPISEVLQKQEIRLRLTAAENNRRIGVTMPGEYRSGAIAQLGERVAGSHEVGGSSPPGSIVTKAAP